MTKASFWRGLADRAVKSAAQSLLLLWGADAGFDILSVSWPQALGLAGGAALLSALTSLISAPVGDDNTTALIPGAS